MDRVNKVNKDMVKYNTYVKNRSKQQQQKHQHQQCCQQENMQGQNQGEPPLSVEELSKHFKVLLQGWILCLLQARLTLTARASKSSLLKT